MCCSNVDADKQYQLADWRIRPLSQEMARYAREDTHYLLYVYDRLRLQLLARDGGQQLLQDVLDRSAAVSLRTYTKPAYDDQVPTLCGCCFCARLNMRVIVSTCVADLSQRAL